MKIVELILDEEQEESGIDAISIVESPAIESDFVALNNQEIKLAELDKEKKILLGALLIPNKPIYRNGNEGDYYIFFSKDTIMKASQMYLKNGYQNNSALTIVPFSNFISSSFTSMFRSVLIWFNISVDFILFI